MPFRSLLAVSLSVATAAIGGVSASPAGRPHRAQRAAKDVYVAPNHSGPLFIVNGHGWGHGVGMGQWGAEGYALHGATYQQILAAYYPGTTLGQSSVDTIRVLLADERKRLTISSDQPVTVVDGDGATHTLDAGTAKLTPALSLAVDGGPPQKLPPPLTFEPADGARLTLGRDYRGQIVVDVVDGKLRAINVVPVEQYLYGVVPSEMPSKWLPAALEAQAVASRSYALANHRAAAPFDVYADTRSQMYLGFSAETPEGNAAVDDTAGQVLLYDGEVADTVFSSSTGGWTQSAADAWGGAGKPYLTSVRDPYDTISPYHHWGPVPVTGKELAHALGVPGRVVDATVTRNGSRRVATVNVTSLVRGRETTTQVAGGTVAASLDLRSSWFAVGVLSLQPPLPNRPVPIGTAVTLTGVVRGVKGVELEQRVHGGPWTTVSAVEPARRTGAISAKVKPRRTTQYRLATSADAAAFVRIRVTPRVALTQAARSSVTGRERPVLPGARVLVEQQRTAGSQRWTIVARGAVAGDGTFTVPAPLEPGPVRVVVAPGKGWWPGASTAATVQ